jgi:hypothetical protein
MPRAQPASSVPPASFASAICFSTIAMNAVRAELLRVGSAMMM